MVGGQKRRLKLVDSSQGAKRSLPRSLVPSAPALEESSRQPKISPAELVAAAAYDQGCMLTYIGAHGHLPGDDVANPTVPASQAAGPALLLAGEDRGLPSGDGGILPRPHGTPPHGPEAMQDPQSCGGAALAGGTLLAGGPQIDAGIEGMVDAWMKAIAADANEGGSSTEIIVSLAGLIQTLKLRDDADQGLAVGATVPRDADANRGR